MSKTEANAPTSLSTMLGTSEGFQVNGKTYQIKPMSLKDVEQFMNDGMSLGPQLFSISNDSKKAITEKWLSKYCCEENGEAMTMQKAMEADWNVVDLKNFILKLCDLSG